MALELEAVVGCPKCNVPTARVYKRPRPDRPEVFEHVLVPIREVRGNVCPDCGAVLERLKG